MTESQPSAQNLTFAIPKNPGILHNLGLNFHASFCHPHMHRGLNQLHRFSVGLLLPSFYKSKRTWPVEKRTPSTSAALLPEAAAAIAASLQLNSYCHHCCYSTSALLTQPYSTFTKTHNQNSFLLNYLLSHCTLTSPRHSEYPHWLCIQQAKASNLLPLQVLFALSMSMTTISKRSSSSRQKSTPDALAPSVSSIEAIDYYLTNASVPDVRYLKHSLQPDSISKQCEPQQIHGWPLLDHEGLLRDPIAPELTILVSIYSLHNGYAFGTRDAKVLAFQRITNPRDNQDQSDTWALYSESNAHGSKNRGLYLIILECDLPKSIRSVLMVTLTVADTKYSYPAFVHPFPYVYKAEILSFFTISFPPGIDPYTILELGDGFKTALIPLLQSVLHTDHLMMTSTLGKNIFPTIGPAITEHTRVLLKLSRTTPQAKVDPGSGSRLA